MLQPLRSFALTCLLAASLPSVAVDASALKPPAGAKHIQVKCGMIPGSYQNGNTTDGVVLEIHEERPDGTVQILFQRAITPLTKAEDRKEVVIDYAQESPFQGVLVFGSYPGPAGNGAFDWTYWRSILVR